MLLLIKSVEWSYQEIYTTSQAKFDWPLSVLGQGSRSDTVPVLGSQIVPISSAHVRYKVLEFGFPSRSEIVPVCCNHSRLPLFLYLAWQIYCYGRYCVTQSVSPKVPENPSGPLVDNFIVLPCVACGVVCVKLLPGVDGWNSLDDPRVIGPCHCEVWGWPRHQYDFDWFFGRPIFTGAKLDGLTRSLAHPRWRTSEAASNQGSVRAVAVWIELNIVMEYHVTNISSVTPAVQRPPGHVGNVREVWKNGAGGPTHKRGHFRMG